MKKIFQEKKLCYIFNALAIIMFFVLFYHSLGSTGTNSTTNMRDEHIYFKENSIIFNLILIGPALFILYHIGKISDKLQNLKVRNIILAIVCMLTGIISIFWVYAGKFEPVADQLFVCLYADAFNQGDFAGLAKGGYVARYPQQLGMITLLRILFSVFGTTNYHAFQYLSAAMVPLLVLAGCKIVRTLSDDNAKVELYYLLFIFLCVPMYIYTPYVYGDLISTVFSMLAIWMFLALLKTFSWWRLVLFSLFIGTAVQLRKNVLILVVALGIVALIKLVFYRSRQSLMALVALVLGVVVTNAAIWAVYRDVRQEDAPEIPAILFVVMGLNDDYGYPGWHNGYETSTFNEVGDNVELATEKAISDLKMYVDIYKEDPEYMVDFFVRKMNSQWNAPMYHSVAMNTYFVEEQLSPVKEIYQYGTHLEVIEFAMKIYQLLLYGSILFLLIMHRKDFVQIEKYALLIAVFGGFLFSFMWEAKTRYVMPYLFMQIPYMAMGISAAVATLEKKLKRKM